MRYYVNGKPAPDSQNRLSRIAFEYTVGWYESDNPDGGQLPTEQLVDRITKDTGVQHPETQPFSWCIARGNHAGSIITHEYEPHEVGIVKFVPKKSKWARPRKSANLFRLNDLFPPAFRVAMANEGDRIRLAADYPNSRNPSYNIVANGKNHGPEWLKANGYEDYVDRLKVSVSTVTDDEDGSRHKVVWVMFTPAPVPDDEF